MHYFDELKIFCNTTIWGILAIAIKRCRAIEGTTARIQDSQEIILRFWGQINLTDTPLIQMECTLHAACFDAAIQFPKPIVQVCTCWCFTHAVSYSPARTESA